jgi:hypothetical protein
MPHQRDGGSGKHPVPAQDLTVSSRTSGQTDPSYPPFSVTEGDDASLRQVAANSGSPRLAELAQHIPRRLDGRHVIVVASQSGRCELRTDSTPPRVNREFHRSAPRSYRHPPLMSASKARTPWRWATRARAITLLCVPG